MKTYSKRRTKIAGLQSKNEHHVFSPKIRNSTKFSSSDDSETLNDDTEGKMKVTVKRTRNPLQERKDDEENKMVHNLPAAKSRGSLGAKKGEKSQKVIRSSKPKQKGKGFPTPSRPPTKRKNFKWSEDENDWSIEKLRRDPDMTWQQKIEYLLPKMNIIDQKQISPRVKDLAPVHKDWSNLSYEEVKESDHSSDYTYTYTYTWASAEESRSPKDLRTASESMIPHKTLTVPSESKGEHTTTSNTEDVSTVTEDEETNSRSGAITKSSREVTPYSYQADIENAGTYHHQDIGSKRPNMNSTLNKQGQDIKEVHFPYDISCIPSTQEGRKSDAYSVQKQQSKKKDNSQKINRTKDVDDVKKVNRNKDVLNSTTANNALNIKASNFPKDLSSIRASREDEEIQSVQEKTPNKMSVPCALAPKKVVQVSSTARKLHIVSPTLLFQSPRHETQHDKALLTHKSGKVHGLPHNITKEKENSIKVSNVPQRVLTSTPIRGETPEEQGNRFEADISTVRMVSADDVLDIHHSLEVNSMEIVPLCDSVEMPSVIQLAEYDKESPKHRKMLPGKTKALVVNRKGVKKAKSENSKTSMIDCKSKRPDMRVLPKTDVKTVLKGYTNVVTKLHKSNTLNKLSKSGNKSSAQLQPRLARDEAKEKTVSCDQPKSELSPQAATGEIHENAELVQIESPVDSVKQGQSSQVPINQRSDSTKQLHKQDSESADKNSKTFEFDDNGSIESEYHENDIPENSLITSKSVNKGSVVPSSQELEVKESRPSSNTAETSRKRNSDHLKNNSKSVKSPSCRQETDTTKSQESRKLSGQSDSTSLIPKSSKKLRSGVNYRSINNLPDVLDVDDLTDWNFVWPRKAVPLYLYALKPTCIRSKTQIHEDDIIANFFPL